MSNEVIFNESYTLYEQKMKILRLLEIILFYVHSKMVAMETIIIYVTFGVYNSSRLILLSVRPFGPLSKVTLRALS